MSHNSSWASSAITDTNDIPQSESDGLDYHDWALMLDFTLLSCNMIRWLSTAQDKCHMLAVTFAVVFSVVTAEDTGTDFTGVCFVLSSDDTLSRLF